MRAHDQLCYTKAAPLLVYEYPGVITWYYTLGIAGARYVRVCVPVRPLDHH